MHRILSLNLLSLAVSGALAAATAAQPVSGAGRSSVRETDHLTIELSTRRTAAAPGDRVSLLVDVAPKPRMHVYAPEQKDYIPVALTLDASAAFRTHPPVFPRAERFFFKPLNETQLVYTKPFRIVQDITLSSKPPGPDRAQQPGGVTITGTLRYQACDDVICYMPRDVRLEWLVQSTSSARR